jgi:hypothetical protein
MPAQEGGTADMSSCRGRPADLVTEGYARELQELVNTQRAAGAQCGLAMRDHLTAEQAVDFLVVSRAAVSVQDDQATRGRISVYFKNVDRWVGRHESMWGTRPVVRRLRARRLRGPCPADAYFRLVGPGRRESLPESTAALTRQAAGRSTWVVMRISLFGRFLERAGLPDEAYPPRL